MLSSPKRDFAQLMKFSELIAIFTSGLGGRIIVQ
jgi:hypothetical protein